MAASGVFLLFAVAALKFLQTILSKHEFKKLFISGGLVATGIAFAGVVLLTVLDVFASWSGRYYSLWDISYADKNKKSDQYRRRIGTQGGL